MSVWRKILACGKFEMKRVHERNNRVFALED